MTVLYIIDAFSITPLYEQEDEDSDTPDLTFFPSCDFIFSDITCVTKAKI